MDKTRTLILTSTKKADYYALKLSISQNEIGIIFRTTAILYAHGWNILEATAETSERGIVDDIFLIQNLKGEQMTEEKLGEIQADLEEMLYKGLSVIDYLGRSKLKLLTKRESDYEKNSVHLYNPESLDLTVMDLHAIDRPGLLFEISEILFLSGIDIISFTAKTEKGEVRDTFLLREESGEKITDGSRIERLTEGILSIL
ncbi:MAG: hypothetical protein K8R21_12160 [Leptospira sp.]|nr:hypothetical protein [Leptospira sp.]